MAKLQRPLKLTQGVPAGIGSGKSALPRKVHALAHAARLVCKSWKQVAQLLNGTTTWTGDLGVEPRLWKFKGCLPSLFGRWVVDSDSERDPIAR